MTNRTQPLTPPIARLPRPRNSPRTSSDRIQAPFLPPWRSAPPLPDAATARNPAATQRPNSGRAATARWTPCYTVQPRGDKDTTWCIHIAAVTMRWATRQRVAASFLHPGKDVPACLWWCDARLLARGGGVAHAPASIALFLRKGVVGGPGDRPRSPRRRGGLGGAWGDSRWWDYGACCHLYLA